MRILNIVLAHSSYRTVLCRSFIYPEEVVTFLQDKVLSKKKYSFSNILPEKEINKIRLLLENDVSETFCEDVSDSIYQYCPSEMDLFEIFISDIK